MSTNTPVAPGDSTAQLTPENHEHPANSNREAAKWRKQLREVEAERDALTARVEAMNRSEAERHASRLLTKPAAMWAAGADLTDLLDDSGAVDPAKVEQAAQRAAEELGATSPRRGPVLPDPGKTPDGDIETGADWTKAFHPRQDD